MLLMDTKDKCNKTLPNDLLHVSATAECELRRRDTARCEERTLAVHPLPDTQGTAIYNTFLLLHASHKVCPILISFHLFVFDLNETTCTCTCSFI